MNNLNFKLYSVLKNEDAPPFLDDNLMIVADGLGGSGSFKYELSPFFNENIWSILRKRVLCFKESNMVFETNLKQLFDPIFLNPINTSATWASRIVMAKCIYGLKIFKDLNLNNKQNLESLKLLILNALEKAKKEFKLPMSENSNQLTLPTTLAFLKTTENKDSVFVEAVWAGDSRCYALTENGLKLLTVDDEDSSGSITNLFYAENKDVKLNYKNYIIKKPCVLLSVTDGFFDPFNPYDNLGFENVLLNKIKEANNINELKNLLKQTYDNINADDASMVFKSFGFVNYNNLKDFYKNRTIFVSQLWQTMISNQQKLNVFAKPKQEVLEYFHNRILDVFPKISNLLLQIYNQKQTDNQKYQNLNDMFSSLEKLKNNNILTNFYILKNKVILPNINLNLIEDYFDLEKLKTTKYKNLVNYLKDFIQDFGLLKSNLINSQQKQQKLSDEKLLLLNDLKEKISNYINKFNLQNDYNLEKLNLIKIVDTLKTVERNFLNNNSKFVNADNFYLAEVEINPEFTINDLNIKNIELLSNDETDLIVNIEKNLQNMLIEKENYSLNKTCYNNSLIKINEKLEYLFDELEQDYIQNGKSVFDIFNEKTILEYNLIVEQNSSFKTVLESNKNKVSNIVCNYLTENYFSQTIFDEFFNKTRLEQLKQYLSLIKNEEEVKFLTDLQNVLLITNQNYFTLVTNNE